MTDTTRIEERLAHLERLTEELSEVLARQDRDLTRLSGQMKLVMQRLAESEYDAGGSVPLADQKPPHW